MLDASSLLIGEAEILDKGDGLSREAQSECLDLFARRFLGQVVWPPRPFASTWKSASRRAMKHLGFFFYV